MYDGNFPRIMGLFQKRIEGDDALLELASLRFKESGLGVELYADTPGELDWLLKFRPSPEIPAVAHLNRNINILEEKSQRLILDFATAFAGRIYGLVIHDQDEITDHFDNYIHSLHTIESRLNTSHGTPYLFIEYAVGLEPDLFIDLFKRIHHLDRISACIDTGHIGIKQARDDFYLGHPGKDVCALFPGDPFLKQIIADVESSVQSSLSTVLKLIHTLGKLGKPLHFHLHDGHPLSTVSAYGVSDHISFLSEIPIPFEFRGRKSLNPMFGPCGLTKIVRETEKKLSTDLISFTLEIHPADERIPLGNASYLFRHWKDLTNAEKMNAWLSVIRLNHKLLLDICMKSNKDILVK